MKLTTSQKRILLSLVVKGLGYLLLFTVMLASLVGYVQDNLQKKHLAYVIMSILGFTGFWYSIWCRFRNGLNNEDSQNVGTILGPGLHDYENNAGSKGK